jgi:hypothetical protein
MSDKMDIGKIKDQAVRVQKECPELFDYLVRRDVATSELVREVLNAIPNPDDLPRIRIPFVDLVVELAQPRDKCSICDDEESLWLTPKLRAILCDICRNGIYLRGTGIGSLVR